jgi:hypothetical protein
MQRIKASELALTLQKGNNTFEINGSKKLLIWISGFFCALYYRFFLFAFARGLNSRQRFIHLSKSSSMSIPSGLT